MASTKDTMLFDKISEGIITCPVTENQFIPQSLLTESVTEEVIRSYIPTRSISLIFWPDKAPQQILLNSLRVFVVLALVGFEPAVIRRLVINDELTDDQLPLALENNNVVFSQRTYKKFPSFSTGSPSSKALNTTFIQRQWAVLAPVFDTIGQRTELEPDCALPFLPNIGKGARRGIAYERVYDGRPYRVVVYRARLHPSYRRNEFLKYDEVAVKEFSDKSSFDKEKVNLEKVQHFNHDHLIKFLASCERNSERNNEGHSTYYLIFPWAEDGDLRQFWMAADAMPRTKELFIWAFEQIVGIADAIKLLHHKNIRHGDIKPQNILHFRTTQNNDKKRLGTLVLADLGVSSHHQKATINRAGGTNTTEVTMLYEAPEAESDRRLGLPRSRRYDMWSLGCMFLELTVWLMYGFEAVEIFRDKRRVSWKNPTTAPGNFFTKRSKGTIEIHSKVEEAINHIRTDPRCEGNTALRHLIDLIEQYLLRTDPSQRAKASEVHEGLQKIFETALEDSSFLFRPVEPAPKIPKFFTPKDKRPLDPELPNASTSTVETIFSDEDPRDSSSSVSSTCSSK